MPTRTLPLSCSSVTEKATFQATSVEAVAMNAGLSRMARPSTAIPSVVKAGTVVVVAVLDCATDDVVVDESTTICPCIHGCGEQMYFHTPGSSNVNEYDSPGWSSFEFGP